MHSWVNAFLSAVFAAQGLSHATIKGNAVAISSCHEGLGDRPDFSHPSLKCFLQVVKRLWPVVCA